MNIDSTKMQKRKLLQYKVLFRYIIIYLILLVNIVLPNRIVGYYPQWVINNLSVDEIDLEVVTHVIHSFAWPNEDGSISSYDGMFGSGYSDIIHEQNSKFLLSLGGWGNHAGFEAIIGDSNLRELFIYNLVSILMINGYDGVDLDWEFPDSEADKENLNVLVFEMDSIFNSIDPDWLISMAIPGSHWWGQWHDFEYLENYVDFFNVMTYGTHGDWSGHSGHLAPLYPSPEGDPDGSCHTNMTYLTIDRDIPKSKINMGMPFWGLKWNSPNINESFTGNTIDVIYYDIPELVGNGWDYYWDNDAFCPYLIKGDSTQIITYENQESIGAKCQYVLDNDYGGVMIWALSYDNTSNGQELIQSIQENYLNNFQKESNIILADFNFNIYPNPFNPVCQLDIDIRHNQFVEIIVNDILGQQIDILNNKRLENGKHQFLLDAKTYPSGIYIVTVKTDNGLLAKKITLLK
ncbi:MAG: hypothetical protein CMG55_04695 [Candidatus Marinimicrobia bacterium]|nr:hypothetical protein [Candidatus Neomarinimicrobiota bacterium]|tara:strand:+ start:673 stop:2058 length:1386 start_codon:yes stop_codon:yes gene_type:complete